MVGPNDDVSLYGAPIAFIDFETTWEGDDTVPFDKRRQHAVQVCVATFELGKTEPEVAFSSYIKPPISIRDEAIHVHGIDDDDVNDSPTIAEVLPSIMKIIEGRVLSAYNLPFDWRVLRDALVENSMKPISFYGLDPLVWARVVQKYEKGKSLSDVARRYGVILKPHDAQEDVLAASKIMGLLLRDMSDGGHVEKSDLVSVDSAWRMTVREALKWEDDLCDYHKRRGVSEPVRYWAQFTGSERAFVRGDQ